MHPKVRAFHDRLWRHFFDRRSNLFYEYRQDDDAFPTPAEVAAGIPNPAGWATGMEDCCLNGGWILDGLLLAYETTGADEWADKARVVWSGLSRLGTISRTPGFVARGHRPGRTDIYPNSSPDQVTAYVCALCQWCQSPLATAADRRLAAEVAAAICRLIESFDFDLPTEDRRPSIYGNTADIAPDRAGRLLLFLKAGAWLTGDAHWAAVYRTKLEESDRARLRCIHEPEPIGTNLHARFQSQAAWRVLATLETDETVRAAIREALLANARSVRHRIDDWRVWQRGPHGPPPPWRPGWNEYCRRQPNADRVTLEGVRGFLHYLHEQSPTFVNDQKHVRQAFDALGIVMMAPDAALRAEAARRGWTALLEVDPSLIHFGTALACLEAGYWRAVQAGLMPAT